MDRELRWIRAAIALGVLCLVCGFEARAGAQCQQPGDTKSQEHQKEAKKKGDKTNESVNRSGSVASAAQDVPWEGVVKSNQCYLVKRTPTPACTLAKKYPVGQACKCNFHGKAEDGEVQ